MCNCTSCSYTDSFSGWPNVEPGDNKGGFENWPRGEPKGAKKSADEYKAHAKHCGSAGLPKPWTFTPGQPPKFSTYGLVMPVTPAPKFVLDWINRDSAKPAPKLEPQRPALAIVPKSKPSMPDDLADFIRRKMAA